MSPEFSPDRAVNHNEVIATYTPELLAARDSFINQLNGLKTQAASLEASNQLPGGVSVTRYEEAGVTQLVYGDLPKDFKEAFKAWQTEKLLADLAMQSEVEGQPRSDLMVITYGYGDVGAKDNEESFAGLEQPVYKIEWGVHSAHVSIENSLSIYKDGYLESSTEAVQEGVNLTPPAIYPSSLEDIQNASLQLENKRGALGPS